MSEPKKLKPKRRKVNCFGCDHCTYIGDGDHLCDLDNEIVVNE